MDTQERVKEISRFVVLVPHRDALKPLEEIRRRLFSSGFSGAYSFPAAAPLAAVSRPFSRQELKELAAAIRDFTRNKGGKIESAGTASYASYDQMTIRSIGRSTGIRLDIPVTEPLFPQTAQEKLLAVFSPPVLCAALVSPEETAIFSNAAAFEKAPSLSFRAASLANLSVRPLPGGDSRYSFEWKIGPPLWLPKNIPPHK